MNVIVINDPRYYRTIDGKLYVLSEYAGHHMEGLANDALTVAAKLAEGLIARGRTSEVPDAILELRKSPTIGEK